MQLEEILVIKIRQCDLKELAVLVNGKPYVKYGKIVYVSLNTDRGGECEIIFYTKATTLESTKRIEIDNALQELKNVLLSNVYAGVTVRGEASLEECTAAICTTIGLLILESQLYATAKFFATNSDKNYSFRFGSSDVEKAKMTELTTAFKAAAFKNYGELVYSATFNRFIGKLYRANKFYAIQKAFVPVFIAYNRIYNPFDDATLPIKQSSLYKMAVARGRIVSINNELSCYMLTHREICQALGMRHFVRFTPTFLYKLMIGFVRPDLPDSMNKINKIAVRPRGLVSSSVPENSFTGEKYEEERELTANQYETEKDIAKKEKYASRLETLNHFQVIDTLHYECLRNYDTLISIGTSSLDRKEQTTVYKLYEYFSEASLQLGDYE